jgi:nucleotide-binding universal stress UspA family protein
MTQPERHYVILAALQLDETGYAALTEAARFASRDPDAELHVVHVVSPSLVPDKSGELVSVKVRLARAPDEIRGYVDRACSGTNLKVVAHIRSGDAAEVILDSATKLNADVLVLGTHHRKGIARWVLGSVAERVFHEAPCPVLIATPKTAIRQATIEPACPDCIATRTDQNDPTVWCERHSRTGLRTHVYSPSDVHHTSQIGT